MEKKVLVDRMSYSALKEKGITARKWRGICEREVVKNETYVYLAYYGHHSSNGAIRRCCRSIFMHVASPESKVNHSKRTTRQQNQ